MRSYLIILSLFGVAGCGFDEQETVGDATQKIPVRTVSFENSIGMKLIPIPAGSFSTAPGYAKTNASPNATLRHTITLSRSYYMGAFEVTQAQYEKVIGTNPSAFKRVFDAVQTQPAGGVEDPGLGMTRPVEMVSWMQAVEFCNRLSELPEEKAAGRVYRLPTEAEWEYAFRAGATNPVYLPGDAKELDHLAWWSGNSLPTTNPVGGKSPNAWGLYDMAGNVKEYCSDWYAEDYPAASIEDPKGPTDVKWSKHVLRGGSYQTELHWMNSNLRSPELVSNHVSPTVGFRVVMQEAKAFEIADVLRDYWDAKPKLLRQSLQLIQSQWESALPSLTAVSKGPASSDAERIKRLLARVAIAAQDPSKLDKVLEDFSTQHVDYFLEISDMLEPQFIAAQQQLKNVLADPNVALHRRIFALHALQRTAPEVMESLWDASWEEQFAQQLVLRLSDESQADFERTKKKIYRQVLRPFRDELRSELINIFEKVPQNRFELQQTNQAMDVLASYYSDDPSLLADLLINAPRGQRGVALDALRVLTRYPMVEGKVTIDRSAIGPEVLEKLSQVIKTPPPSELEASQRVRYATRRVNAASYFFELEKFEEVLPLFDWKDDPEAVTQWMLQGMASNAFLTFVSQLPPGKTRDTAFYASLLSNPNRLSGPHSEEQKFWDKVLDWYANEPNSAVHSAIRWFLKKNSKHQLVDQLDETAVPYSPNREWFTMKIPLIESKSTSVPLSPYQYACLTFVVFQPGTYTVEPMEISYAQGQRISRKTLVLDRPVALLDREISRQELNAFQTGKVDGRNSHPMKCSWYESVAFCRWLTVQAGMSEMSQVYVDPSTLDASSVPFFRSANAQDFPIDWPCDLKKPGFRLPTNTEWEIATRGETSTAYGFGNDESLLPEFAWSQHSDYRHMSTSIDRSRWMDGRSLLPNLRGMFDMHGNYEEWVNDWSEHSIYGSPEDQPRLGILRGGNAMDVERTRSSSWATEVRSRLDLPVSFRLAITLPDHPNSNDR